MAKTVLVVEDDPIIRMGAVDLVTAAGFDVLEAGNAEDAIRILEMRSDVDLVFTDIEMPGTMDGLKLAHYISERWPPVKLLLASGRMILEQSHLPKGAMFFSKPYQDDTIVETIRVMVAELGTGTSEVRSASDTRSPAVHGQR